MRKYTPIAVAGEVGDGHELDAIDPECLQIGQMTLGSGKGAYDKNRLASDYKLRKGIVF